MKSRLKTYIVTIGLSHESFGGYDHNDGEEKIEVKALNVTSAGKKGLAISRKDCGGYSIRPKEVQNKNDKDDWVYYS